jgi:hypothetical protein
MQLRAYLATAPAGREVYTVLWGILSRSQSFIEASAPPETSLFG